MKRIDFNISEWAAAADAKVTTWLFAAVSRTSSRLRSVREGVAALACRAKTGHLRWQQALREKRNHLEKLLADSPEPMVVTDGALRFVAANPAALALFGVSKTNIGKFAIDAFLSTQQVDFFKHGGPPFVRGATRLGECEIRCFDGRVKVVDYIFQPNFIPGRHLANFRDAHPERGILQFSSENSLAPHRFPDPRRARSFPEAHSGKPHLY
jgi:PAS domain-containing protein